MKFMVDINTDNAAFDYPGYEVARILDGLSELARDYGLESMTRPVTLRDANGNPVGSARWAE